jgi:hypothetical protein
MWQVLAEMEQGAALQKDDLAGADRSMQAPAHLTRLLDAFEHPCQSFVF